MTCTFNNDHTPFFVCLFFEYYSLQICNTFCCLATSLIPAKSLTAVYIWATLPFVQISAGRIFGHILDSLQTSTDQAQVKHARRFAVWSGGGRPCIPLCWNHWCCSFYFCSTFQAWILLWRRKHQVPSIREGNCFWYSFSSHSSVAGCYGKLVRFTARLQRIIVAWKLPAYLAIYRVVG